MRRPETVPQLQLVVRTLDEPKQDTTSPKKRKQRAVSGAPNQVLAWTGFNNDHDMELKRRKLEQAEDPSAHIDAAAAGDLHRMAHHLGVADASVEQDVKTVADALRTLLKCIEKVEYNDQSRRDLVYRLSGPVMAAMDIVHEKQLSELAQATKRMDELNHNTVAKLLENESRETQQSRTAHTMKFLNGAAELLESKIHENKMRKDTIPETKIRKTHQLPAPPRLCFESDYSVSIMDSSSSSGSDNTYSLYAKPYVTPVLPPASEARSVELFQQEIQKNYREFEEKALRKSVSTEFRRKDSTTTVSTDTVGDMDFERIFLGDSDEEGGWSSSPSGSDGSERGDVVDETGVDGDGEGNADVDGLSEDMDGLEVEVYVDEMEKKDGVAMEERLGRMGYWEGSVS
jgi:hypothetical protein